MNLFQVIIRSIRVKPFLRLKAALVSRCVCGLILTYLFLIANPTLAQQNLFNIPSGDITPKGELFYQHQFNFYTATELESKSHFVYGLGKGWDAGVNLVDLPLQVGDVPALSFNDNSNRKPLYPLLMFTLQKQFQLNKHLKLNVGSQVGPNLSPQSRNKRVAFFNYVLVKSRLFKHVNLTIGTYHTDNTFVGKEKHHFGILAGYEIPLTKRLSLMGDVISGNHKKSQSTIGALYTISKRVQVCGAALLDYPHGQKNHGVVLELNLFGWDIDSHQQ